MHDEVSSKLELMSEMEVLDADMFSADALSKLQALVCAKARHAHASSLRDKDRQASLSGIARADKTHFSSFALGVSRDAVSCFWGYVNHAAA